MPQPEIPQPPIDPDFAHEVLDDLYAYRRKRRWVAWALWVGLGWLGAHRFYLERPGTGLLQMLTGGGALVWWVLDAWRIGPMVDAHAVEQERRQRVGEPPVELAFMPPRAVDVLSEPPQWTRRWADRGRAWRGMRLAGDLLVLAFAGTALGLLAGVEGGTEAAVAVVALILVTLLGDHANRLNKVPVLRALVRWGHRLRLFYYVNRPASPLGLLLRSAIGVMLAPFRRRDRAEVGLYLQLGAAFTLFFMAADLIEDVVAPLLGTGLRSLDPARLAALWFQELFTTFLVIYVFAAPVGAILTLYLLTRETHTIPRLLGLVALAFMALGAAI